MCLLAEQSFVLLLLLSSCSCHMIQIEGAKSKTIPSQPKIIRFSPSAIRRELYHLHVTASMRPDSNPSIPNISSFAELYV